MIEEPKSIVKSFITEISNRVDKFKDNMSKKQGKRYLKGIARAVCAPLIPMMGIKTYREIMNNVDEYSENILNLAMGIETDNE